MSKGNKYRNRQNKIEEKFNLQTTANVNHSLFKKNLVINFFLIDETGLDPLAGALVSISIYSDVAY